MTVEKRDVSSTPIINKSAGPKTATKTRDMTVKEAKDSAKKVSRKYGNALKELARR